MDNRIKKGNEVGVLNIFKAHDPKTPEVIPENQVIHLDDLDKERLLDFFKSAALDPETYVIAVATELVKSSVAPKDMITVSEWLEEQRIRLTDSEYKKLSMMASNLYAKEYGTRPRWIFRPSKEKTGRQTWSSKFRGFEPSRLSVLQEAYEKLRSGKATVKS